MSWFPITDPSREDDIRMRRKRATMLLACIVFVPWIMLGGPDHRRRPTHVRIDTAPGLSITVPERTSRGGIATQRFAAATLRVELPCAGTVSVLPDPTLDGAAVLSAPQDVLDAISISAGTVSSAGSCGDDAPVTIRTGTITPLTLVQSGANDLRAGRFDGPVTIESTGSGDVSLEHAGTLTVRGEHSGDVTVGSVTGPLHAAMNGSGDLRVSGGTIPVLDATSGGSADLLLDRVAVLGGQVMLEGSGDLHLGRVLGSVAITTESSGDVVINDADAEHLSLRGTGSGDISLRAGHVAILDAVRHGSGDLDIDATIGAGRLDRSGSGDVSIPPGGALTETRH